MAFLVSMLLIVSKYTSVFSCYVGCGNDKGENSETQDKTQNDSSVLHDLLWMNSNLKLKGVSPNNQPTSENKFRIFQE